MQAAAESIGLLKWHRSIHSPNFVGAFLLLPIILGLGIYRAQDGSLDAQNINQYPQRVSYAGGGI